MHEEATECLFCDAENREAALKEEIKTLRWKLEDCQDNLSACEEGYPDDQESAAVVLIKEMGHHLRYLSSIDDLCGPVLERTTEMDKLHRTLTSIKELAITIW